MCTRHKSVYKLESESQQKSLHPRVQPSKTQVSKRCPISLLLSHVLAPFYLFSRIVQSLHHTEITSLSLSAFDFEGLWKASKKDEILFKFWLLKDFEKKKNIPNFTIHAWCCTHQCVINRVWMNMTWKCLNFQAASNKVKVRKLILNVNAEMAKVHFVGHI